MPDTTPPADTLTWHDATGRTRLDLTTDGTALRVALTYGTDHDQTVAVTLDNTAVRQLADLAVRVRQVLDAGGQPSPAALDLACGTVQGLDGIVSVHARMLRVHGGQRAWAADVFVHRHGRGNYHAGFRRREWVAITDALTTLADAELDTAHAQITEADVALDGMIAAARAALAAATTQTERADTIAGLLAEWYAAQPTSMIADPHWPIAHEIVTMLAVDQAAPRTPEPLDVADQEPHTARLAPNHTTN